MIKDIFVALCITIGIAAFVIGGLWMIFMAKDHFWIMPAGFFCLVWGGILAIRRAEKSS